MAQSRNRHDLHGPGQRHHSNGSDVHIICAPGPINKHFVATSKGVFKVTEGDKAHDVVHISGCDVPRAIELLSRDETEAGGARGRHGVSGVQLKHVGIFGGVRVVGEWR